MTEEEMLDLLSRYGISAVQARLYHILIKLAGAPASDVAEEMGVHRSEVYRVARELRDIGLVEEHAVRPVVFEPKPPDEILDKLLEERTRELQSLKQNAPSLVEWLEAQAGVQRTKPFILLIDDDELTRRSLSLLLESMGFEVEDARSGGEALEKAGSGLHDVALVDIRLPDISGTGLLGELKDRNPGIKEIIITGHPSLENAIEALNEGADAYLLKPIEHQVLLAKIQELVKGQ